MLPLDDFFAHLFRATALPEGDIGRALMGKKARKKLKKAAKKSGGAAAIASLGYLAYQQWQRAKETPPPLLSEASIPSGGVLTVPPNSLEVAADEVLVSECLKSNLILAMICAASADGVIDREEMDQLLRTIDRSDLPPEDSARLTRAINRPPLLEEVAALALSPLEACELYGAAYAAIREDTPAETLFLRRFAKALKLDDDLVETVQEVSGMKKA